MKIPQMVDAWHLACAIDDSCDNYGYLSIHGVLEEKRGYLHPSFVRSIKRNGVKIPIAVVVRPDGRWIMGNGHHRLVVAMDLGIEIPVIFYDGGLDFSFDDTSSKRYVGSDGEKLPG